MVAGLPLNLHICFITESFYLIIVNSLNMEKGAGRAVSTLWVEGCTIQLPVDLALGLLQALELYALDCYGVTAAHLSYVEGSQSIQELRDFNKEANIFGVIIYVPPTFVLLPSQSLIQSSIVDSRTIVNANCTVV
mgnify:CR=1 FL=1